MPRPRPQVDQIRDPERQTVDDDGVVDGRTVERPVEVESLLDRRPRRRTLGAMYGDLLPAISSSPAPPPSRRPSPARSGLGGRARAPAATFRCGRRRAAPSASRRGLGPARHDREPVVARTTRTVGVVVLGDRAPRWRSPRASRATIRPPEQHQRSAYCAASVRSCIAATTVSSAPPAARRRARAPAAGDRCRARPWARRAAASPPPARAPAPGRPAGARRRSAFPAAVANSPSSRRSSVAGGRLAVVPPLAGERAEVRRAPEQHVLARRSSTAAVTGDCGTKAIRARPVAPRERGASAPSSAIDPSSGRARRRRAAASSCRRRSGRSAPPTRRPRRQRRRPSTTVAPPSRPDPPRAEIALTRSSCCVRSTIAKNGAPKNAVTTPIGSSAGRDDRARDHVGEHEEAAAEEHRERQQTR